MRMKRNARPRRRGRSEREKREKRDLERGAAHRGAIPTAQKPLNRLKKILIKISGNPAPWQRSTKICHVSVRRLEEYALDIEVGGNQNEKEGRSETHQQMCVSEDGSSQTDPGVLQLLVVARGPGEASPLPAPGSIVFASQTQGGGMATPEVKPSGNWAPPRHGRDILPKLS